MAPSRITSFLVKVASRCNLDCDYCYVYHHADQSWRKMPKLLSAEDQAAFIQRLVEYVAEVGLTRCAVVFHGGEPLLAGVENLVSFANRIRTATPAEVEVGLQTNGLLLTERALEALEAADIAVSLSLDGPRAANDKHRNSRKGRSSFDGVLAALERLKRRPKIFAGVIAVIDPSTPPEDLLAFFDEHQPPRVDFLLPDAHHLRPPPGRTDTPDLYETWQRRAFDLWLDEYPHLPVRMFEALLDAVAGLPSTTDAFGLGDVSLISIETDGSYHDLDVLKVTSDGATKIGGGVQDTPISTIAASAHIATHRRLLTKAGLCATCRACSIVEICGGGSLPHRYGDNGFDNPTVYCREMTALVSHVRSRLDGLLAADAKVLQALPDGFDISRYELAETALDQMQHLCEEARQVLAGEFVDAVQASELTSHGNREFVETFMALDPERRAKIGLQPGAVAWQRTQTAALQGRATHAVDGTPLVADPDYLSFLLERSELDQMAVGLEDAWLRRPFGDAILFENEAIASQARPLVEQALTIIESWRPALGAEIRQACRAIQFVRDPSAHPEKIVSFSDNSVPGALYVSVWQGDRMIDPYDLADSLIHEHRHQKLYLLERLAATVQGNDVAVVSPWREDLRPPSGLLHAVFVFVELRRFWLHVRDHGPSRLHNRAANQLQDTDERLAEAFSTLDLCPLTTTGRALTEVLRRACVPLRELA